MGLRPPLDVILSWPKPNYVNPETRGNGVLVGTIVLGIITYLVVGGRIWARLFVQRNAGLDDWLVIAAMVPLTGLMVTIPLTTENYGFDRHVWDVRPELIVPGRKLVIVNEILFVVSTGLIKMSVLLFYRRIVDRSISRTFIIINWTCIATFAASIVIFLFLPFVACTPLSAFWDQVNPALRKNMYPHKCVNEGAHLLAATIISCIQDFIATTIPASLWRKITLPTRQKVALAGVFAIGYSGCVIAVLRTYYIWKIFYGTWDVTWVTWIGWLLTIIEATMAAICASLPALRVIFRRFLGATVASASNSLGRTPSRSWRSLKAWVAPRSQSGYANQLGGDGGSGIAGGDLGSRSQIVMQKEITIASSTELNDYPTDEESQRRPEDLPTNRPQPGEAF